MSAERRMRNADLAPAVFAVPNGQSRRQPDRARTGLLAVVPAMNRWAIIGRPFGTCVPGGIHPGEGRGADNQDAARLQALGKERTYA